MSKEFDISSLAPSRIGEMLDTRTAMHEETGCTSDCRRNGCPDDEKPECGFCGEKMTVYEECENAKCPNKTPLDMSGATNSGDR